jgi:tetratricopeptide (TPR) repeat protein
MLAALHGAKVPESLADQISRETEGNPFFIQEIVRHLMDEGLLARGAELAAGSVQIEDMRLPEGVRDVIGRRLGRLSEPCTNVLTAAAVVGREFGLDVLEQIAEVDEQRLVAVLEEAVAARVIEEVPRVPSAGLRTGIGRYRFAHALIRETLYEELRTLDRVRRHQRVAGVLEALYARNPGPNLAELAYHFLEALPGGDVDKAVDYATRAGDRAGEQLAYEEAALHYERALQALELVEQPNEKLRCQLLLKLGEARWSAGAFGFERTMGSFRQAVELAERLGDAELLARAALGSAGPGVGVFTLLEEEDCLTLLTRALTLLEERDSALRAQVMARHAALRTFVGDPQGRESLGRAAIEMARRVGDKGALAYVLNVSPWAVWGPDNLEEGLAMAEEVIRLAGETGDARLAAEGHMWKAAHLLEIGDIAGFDRETGIQERFAETSRQAFHRWLAALSRGARALLAGRFE